MLNTRSAIGSPARRGENSLRMQEQRRAKALAPPPTKERWLGRAKHVKVLGGSEATVGVPASLVLRLGAAKPADSSAPPSSLSVQVLAPSMRVVWAGEVAVPASVTELCVPFGPLVVAGDLTVRLALDGASLPGSPFPLHVHPGPCEISKCELACAKRNNSASCRAGEPGTFFVLLRDRYGNRAGARTGIRTPSPLIWSPERSTT